MSWDGSALAATYDAFSVHSTEFNDGLDILKQHLFTLCLSQSNQRSLLFLKGWFKAILFLSLSNYTWPSYFLPTCSHTNKVILFISSTDCLPFLSLCSLLICYLSQSGVWESLFSKAHTHEWLTHNVHCILHICSELPQLTLNEVKLYIIHMGVPLSKSNFW